MNGDRSHGGSGATVIATTTTIADNFNGFLVVADATITSVAFRGEYDAVAAQWAGLVIPAGVYVPALFSSIQLASGTVITYK